MGRKGCDWHKMKDRCMQMKSLFSEIFFYVICSMVLKNAYMILKMMIIQFFEDMILFKKQSIDNHLLDTCVTPLIL